METKKMLDKNGLEYYTGKIKSLILETTHPIGSLEINTSGTNPSKYLGGVWESFGSGRTLVGVNTRDTSFNTVEKTGGEKTHTLTINEMPSHNHNRARIKHSNQFLGPAGGSNANVAGINLNNGYYPYTNETENNVEVSNTGGGQAHNNLQPYITVYFWKRIK